MKFIKLKTDLGNCTIPIEVIHSLETQLELRQVRIIPVTGNKKPILNIDKLNATEFNGSITIKQLINLSII